MGNSNDQTISAWHRLTFLPVAAVDDVTEQWRQSVDRSPEQTDQCLAPIQFQRMDGNLKRMRGLGIVSGRGQMGNLRGATRTISAWHRLTCLAPIYVLSNGV
jgi:hypothetical protein